MDEKKSGITTDLGLLQVVSQGKRDVVFLTHNNEKIFTVSCESGKESRLRQSTYLMTLSEQQRSEIFTVYDRWKRTKLKDFHLPPGRTRDGHVHPWKAAQRPRTQAKPAPNRGEAS